MFDNTNYYTLSKEVIAGFTHYYVSFTDGESKPCETEVSRTVYSEFLRFIKRERNLRRRDERHMEHSCLPSEVLHEQVVRQAKSAEEVAFDSLCAEELQQAIAELTKTQQRRLLLYFYYGLTYENIAKIEDCTFQAVAKSIATAKDRIKNLLLCEG